MAKNVTICVGTLGQGIWRSADGGETWARVRQGLYSESAVRALAVHPRESHIMYAGAESGIYRSDDRGASWTHLDSPMNTLPIWALAIDPVDPHIMFAGTRPAALFRSQDGGTTWQKLSVALAEECPNVGIPRVTAIAIDPVDHRRVWAGIEVDGVRRSLDGGDTWETITSGVSDPDIHNVAISAGPQ
ncbi:MAG: WD40/YVTN/BNR-like repeat-containing protein, partial [Candidatus Entotheonellia bacterium]